jgi:hypothetical protein
LNLWEVYLVHNETPKCYPSWNLWEFGGSLGMRRVFWRFKVFLRSQKGFEKSPEDSRNTWELGESSGD